MLVNVKLPPLPLELFPTSRIFYIINMTAVSRVFFIYIINMTAVIFSHYKEG